ncbi:MAG: hypothetical protein WCW47_00320 [Candidatus Paceibacterota bacterium]|jgi:hypothetical protein
MFIYLKFFNKHLNIDNNISKHIIKYGDYDFISWSILALLSRKEEKTMSWEKEVSDLTDDSTSKVAEAGHDFRDDSGVREGRDQEEINSLPEGVDPNSSTESGIPLFPERTRE